MFNKKFNFEALGCIWEIKIFDEDCTINIENLQTEIKKLSTDFENRFSRFIKTSEIRKISDFIGEKKVSPEMIKILQKYREFNLATKGKFTPLIGQVLVDLGYDENYSLIQKRNPKKPIPLSKVLEIKEGRVTLKEKVHFDFGGIGKGYLIDKIKTTLRAGKIKNFLINGSGDIYHSGKREIRAGLEDPLNPQKIIGISSLKNSSLCASSKNRRNWGKNTHIIDPQKLEKINESNNILATWTIAKKATIADAIATSLFFTDPTQLKKYFNFEYLILFKNYKIQRSKNFKLLPQT